MDFKKHRLWISAVALVLLVVAAVSTTRQRATDVQISDPAKLLPKITKDAIDGLEIAAPGKQKITLQKQDGSWKVAGPVDSPADQGSVDAMLDKLGELEVTGVAASRKENHAKLQVDADKGIYVKILEKGKPSAELYIGAAKSAATMVRVKDKDEVLSVRGSIRYAFDKELKFLRDRKVVDVSAESLTALTLTSANGTYKFVRADGGWKQADKEKAIERFSATKVGLIASAVARLTASDFADAGITPAQAGFDKPTANVTAERKDDKGVVETIVLELGGNAPGGTDFYLRTPAKPFIYRVSKYTAERMQPKSTDLQEPEKKAGEPSAQAPDMHGMPPGMMGGGGMLGGADGQIPPDVLAKLKAQMAAQQGH